MSVSTTTNRTTYVGDGTTTTFPFAYYFSKQTDLFVYVYDTLLGGVTALVLGTDYTVTGTPNAQGLYTAGGGISTTTAPLATSIIVTLRSPSQIQNYSLLQGGQISSAALIAQLDYQALLIQRLQDQISRAVILPDGLGAAFNTILPSTLNKSPGSSIIVKQDGSGVDIGPSSWQLVTVPFGTVQFGGLSHSIAAFQLPQGAILSGIAIKHTQQFAGGAISGLTFSLGVLGQLTEFINGFDGFQTPTDNAVDGIAPNLIGSFSGPTNILLTSTAVGANLSALTQGSLNVYYQYFIL